MTVRLSDEATKQARLSIRRYYAEAFELETEITDLQVIGLLDFFLKEIAPSVHNAAIAEAQVYLRDRVADLESVCSQPEFVYWPKGSAVRRKG